MSPENHNQLSRAKISNDPQGVGLRKGLSNFEFKLAMRKRYLNYMLAEQRYKEKAEILDTFPYHAFIDPSTICNLRCPFCAVGKGTTEQVKHLMPFDDFKSIMDMVGQYLLQVEIYQYGEPFLNPDIYRMIEYAKSFHIYTRISTSLNVFNREKADRLVASGLDYLTLSIDGASQEAYSKYRVGGNFDKVISNVEMILEAKKARKSKTPLLVWQFLLFKHNEHEVEKAREMAKKMGIDVFSLMLGYVPPEEKEWVPSEDIMDRYGLLNSPERGTKPDALGMKKYDVCKWLWTHLIVSSNGIISPCCRRSVNIPEFGNIFEVKEFMDLWNSDGFRSARRFFATGKLQEPKTLCETCPIENRSVVPLAFSYHPSSKALAASFVHRAYKKLRLYYKTYILR